MIKITVIVPIFNMEKYIRTCLESILEQTLKEIEIICIDDGSTDHTREIISCFQKQHQSIIYVKQENRGAGPARNLGMELATGKYLAFMDADDFYPDCFSMEYLYKMAETSGVDMCGGSRSICHKDVIALSGSRKELIFEEDKRMPSKEFRACSGYQQFIYNTDFIKRNGLNFPDYRRGQDPPFFVKALALAKEITVCKICSYCYRKEHKEVIFDERKALDHIKGMRDTLRITAQCDMREMYTSVLNDFFGESSAIMYKYITDGSQEMLKLLREIKKLISPAYIVKENYVHEKTALLEENEISGYVKRIRDHWRKCLDQLREEKILIFGAGIMARKLYKLLRKGQVFVEAFIVSDTKQNVPEIEGINVRQMDDYIWSDHSEYYVLFSAFGFWKNEIDLLLEQKGFFRRIQVDAEALYLCADEITH